MNLNSKKSRADLLLQHLRSALNQYQVMQEDLDTLMSTASQHLAKEIGTSTTVAHQLLELVLDKEVEINQRRMRPISSSEIEELIEKHINNTVAEPK